LNDDGINNDAGSVLETMYHEEQAGTWRTFAFRSVLLAVVVLILFAIYDYILYSPGVNLMGNCKKIWVRLSILRYGIMLPISFIYLGIFYLESFQTNLAFAEATTAIGMFLMGLCIVGTSVVGMQPGYGVLALYVVFALNVSLVSMFYRSLVLLLCILSYVILVSSIEDMVRDRSAQWYCLENFLSISDSASYDSCIQAAVPPQSSQYLNGTALEQCLCQDNSLTNTCVSCLADRCSDFERIGYTNVFTDAMYLLVFFVGQAIPVVIREMQLRLNFFRTIQMEHARQKVTQEQARNQTLLYNLLPVSVAE